MSASSPSSPSSSEPPTPTSARARSFSSTRSTSHAKPDQPSSPPHEEGYRPYDSFDSDGVSSGRNSPGPARSDQFSPYHDEPKLSVDLESQTFTEQSPRRAYFGHAPSHSESSSLEFDNKEMHLVGDSSSIPFPFPWGLPFPSHARSTTTHRVDPSDNDPRTDSLSFFQSQPFWLILYFCFNLGLTLYNKAVLIHFPYGYALTALHALCGSIGGFTLLRLGLYVPKKLSNTDNIALLAFSLLYTVNIAVSNLSLELVTIPFHQVVRAATPIFTVLLSMFLFGTRSSRHKLASLVPVTVGVGFATYGDYYFTTYGFFLTLLGTVLAAVKTIYTSVLQSSPSSASQSTIRYLVPPRLQLHPLDLLTRMAPLAFIECVILSYMSGELEHVRHWSTQELTPWTAVALGLNGAIAFGLNIISFTANKKVGPLSMTVAANVKQVLSIFLAVSIFNLSISTMNGLGIVLTIVGGAWFASVEYREKKARARGG